MSRFTLRPLWRAIFFAALIAVALLALWPKASPLHIQASDKLQHGLAFAALTILMGIAASSRAAMWRGACGLVAYGAVIELAQRYIIPGRQGELLDLVADGIGIVVALSLLVLLSKRFPKTFRLISQGRR